MPLYTSHPTSPSGWATDSKNREARCGFVPISFGISPFANCFISIRNMVTETGSVFSKQERPFENSSSHSVYTACHTEIDFRTALELRPMRAQAADSGDGFRKRRFTARTLLIGVGQFIQNIPGLVRAIRADRVDKQFAEKIMLAVTAVNECRYCTRYHTGLARETGVAQTTIDHILQRDIEAAVSQMERPALVFAQRYAEADGNPPSQTHSELRETYDTATAADVVAFVRAIYFGNLAGNTVDALRFAAGRRVRRASGQLSHWDVTARDALSRLRKSCPL